MQFYNYTNMTTMYAPYRTSVVVLPFGLMLVMLACRSSEAATFAYQPHDCSAAEGKPAHFACIFEDITDDMKGKYKVIWTKDSNIISEPRNKFDLKRFSFQNQYAIRQHSLKIDPVTREDEGGYQCHLYFNDDIVLTSNTGDLTVREIPLKMYPSVVTANLSYMTGDEVVVRCLCERTDPKPRLEWQSPEANLLRPSPSTGNETHIWIEATMSATVSVNGICLDCKLIVEDEDVPRHSRCTKRLHIDDLQTEPMIPNIDDQPVTSAFSRTSRIPLKRKYMEISVASPNEGRSLLLSHYAIGIISGLVCFIQLSL